MRIAVGADHAGYELKRDLAAAIAQQGHEILDVGTFTAAAVDYPDIAEAVATAIRNGQVDRGIIVCGSGAGVSVAANKFPGIRAAVCHDAYTAKQAVEHDDLNVLCLGARVIGASVAKLLTDTFIAATFSAEDRHLRRIAKIDAIESKFSHE
jgi:ribose 5-phosphate isomerase B